MKSTTRDARIAAGVCVNCSRPSRPGRVRCQTCTDCDRRAMEARRARRADQGICRCGKSPYLAGKKYCAVCTAKSSEKHRKTRALIRPVVFAAYGGQCACLRCPERTTDLRLLTIDHINNDGAEHRRAIAKTKPRPNANRGSLHVFMWLHRQFRDTGKWPEGFQILCGTCNFGKAMNKGVCPHLETH